MTNKGNSSVRLITWGAAVQSVKVPNDKGIFGDVVLGYDTIEGTFPVVTVFVNVSRFLYFGNIIGCLTNHVSSDINVVNTNACGYRSIDNYTKGDVRAFDDVNWESCIVGKQVVMSNLSYANVEGWRGKMLTQVKFAWTDENQLHVNIRASSTEPTPVNITTRCLFNLAGHGTGASELRNHVVTVNAGRWTFMDVRDKIPTGAIRSVDSTIYDLRFPTQLTKQRLRQVPGGGYDHNLCVNAPSCWCYRFHARLLHPGSGRFMEVYSNQPGLHIYTGNDFPEPGQSHLPDIKDCCWGECGDRTNSNESLPETVVKREKETPGKDGILYRRHGGLMLSPQNYPNAVNTPGFPSCILYPGKVYAHDMTYKFGVLRKI
ncbi:galactose mutarotase-like [Neodiprion fabricii]|uniref:galactose mutarotase-like n=1 Tax=Neodiprion fabricii TaxID=2872261 RepID=UPI001ED97772|nr:galactose mutarotase-like [Neodiprion fabricii]